MKTQMKYGISWAFLQKQIVVLIARFQEGNNDKRVFEIEEMIQDYYPNMK